MTSLGERTAYCLANVAAILGALYVAFWLDLDRPYWAMFSVFIVAKPISGAVRAKGVYRFIGTLVGASMSVFLVPPLVQAPVLLSLAVSVWTGACIFLALQDRTPRSYAFLLAGYSVAIVGLSTVNAPTTVFDVAVSRLEEITIGIVCAAVAHSVFFPRNLADVLRVKTDDAIRHAACVASKAVGPNPVRPSTAEIAALATTVGELESLYSQIGHETSNVPRRSGVMGALLDQLAGILPRASLICRSRDVLKRKGPLSEPVCSILADASATLTSLAHKAPGSARFELAQTPDFELPGEGGDIELRALETLVARNAMELAAALIQSRTLALALTEPDPTKSAAVPVPDSPRPSLYCDQTITILSAASAAAATAVACALWIETSWPEGVVAAQFAAIGCSLFASLDAPTKPIFAAVVGILVALPAAALYEFAILPGIDGFASLGLVLTPAMLLFSYLQTFERLEGAAMVLAIAFSGALALQQSFASNFASFVNANVAEIIGLLIAAAMLLVFRTIDPVWNAHRILNSGWAILRQVAGSRAGALTAWVLPMFDRAGLAAIRLAAHASDNREEDVLAGLRIGLNLAELQRCRDKLDGTAGAYIDDAMHDFANLGPERRRSDITTRQGLSANLAHLSTALGRLLPARAIADGIVAITGLRLDLDPSFVEAAS